MTSFRVEGVSFISSASDATWTETEVCDTYSACAWPRRECDETKGTPVGSHVLFHIPALSHKPPIRGTGAPVSYGVISASTASKTKLHLRGWTDGAGPPHGWQHDAGDCTPPLHHPNRATVLAVDAQHSRVPRLRALATKLWPQWLCLRLGAAIATRSKTPLPCPVHILVNGMRIGRPDIPRIRGMGERVQDRGGRSDAHENSARAA
jgi:hypothetical protein